MTFEESSSHFFVMDLRLSVTQENKTSCLRGGVDFEFDMADSIRKFFWQ